MAQTDPEDVDFARSAVLVLFLSCPEAYLCGPALGPRDHAGQQGQPATRAQVPAAATDGLLLVPLMAPWVPSDRERWEERKAGALHAVRETTEQPADARRAALALLERTQVSPPSKPEHRQTCPYLGGSFPAAPCR